MPRLPDFSALRVLVVGDVMIDRYLTGRVERISPEAPVPVIRLEGEENRLGGAANVALNLQSLGVEGGVAGVVGHDANAEVFRRTLAEAGLVDRYLVTDPRRQTTVKTRVIAQSQQLLRADREDRHWLEEAPVADLLSVVGGAIAEGIDLILLQDYNKGVLSSSVIAALLDLAKEKEVPVAVDPKKENFWAYRGVTLFKPNLREIQQQLDFEVLPATPPLDRAAVEIFDRLDCAAVMITLSEHGIYINDRKRSAIYPTQARWIADVSGAGDTVISVAAAGIAAGLSWEAIARLANLAGAQVIARPGVVPVDLQALKQTWQAVR